MHVFAYIASFKPYIGERFADFATSFVRRMMNVTLKFMPKMHLMPKMHHIGR